MEEQRERGGNVTETTLARMSDPLFELCQPRYIFRFAPRVQKRLLKRCARAGARKSISTVALTRITAPSVSASFIARDPSQ